MLGHKQHDFGTQTFATGAAIGVLTILTRETGVPWSTSSRHSGFRFFRPFSIRSADSSVHRGVLFFRSTQMRNLPIKFLSVCLIFAPVGYFQIAGQQTPPAEPVGAGRFRDATKELCVSFRHRASPTSKKYLLETMGSGVAVFDYDNDGRLDIFLSDGARLDDPMPTGAIHRKDGQKSWT